ncbi:hypothetical protein [Rhizobium ruizarguesonis]|uniref:hypothetical protein n=1 Tax=Rhizobium ruizarguesonis TaxID=2081791 RepID=UPI0013EE75F8|nr:hypothetical protein [Rhizobium ruizarguesonis]
MAGEIPEEVASLLDPTMESELFDKVTVGKATYYFVNQHDNDSGEQVIVRSVPGEPPRVEEDILAEDQVSGAPSVFSDKLQAQLRANRGDDFVPQSSPSGGPVLSQSELDRALSDQAVKSATRPRMSSADAPGTQHGNLACAWAVNRVTEMALGREIGGGLATASMVVVLRNKHKKINKPVSGCVVISPTVTGANGRRNIGHVGIVGVVDDSDDDGTKIYSNSSGAAEFQQNKTLKSWIGQYKTGKGLSVEFYELEPRLFPNAGV